MATSPLPDVLNLEAEIEKMKIAVGLADSDKTIENLPAYGDSSNNTQALTEKDLVLNITSSPSSNYNDCDIVISGSTSHSKKNMSETNKPHQKSSKSADGNNLPEDVTNNTDSSEEYKTKRRRRKKVTTKKRSKPKDITSTKNASASNRQIDMGVKKVEASKPEEEIFQMDDFVEGEDEGFASTGALSRSVSLPLSAKIDDLFSHEWTRRKMSSTFAGEFHPFSDGDVTPQSR